MFNLMEWSLIMRLTTALPVHVHIDKVATNGLSDAKTMRSVTYRSSIWVCRWNQYGELWELNSTMKRDTNTIQDRTWHDTDLGQGYTSGRCSVWTSSYPIANCLDHFDGEYHRCHQRAWQSSFDDMRSVWSRIGHFTTGGIGFFCCSGHIYTI